MSQPLLGLLNSVLGLEYTTVVHYPRLADMARDAETRNQVNKLGVASVRHADLVAKIITRLKGKPDWSLRPFSMEGGMSGIFRRQLESEESTRKLHLRVASLMRDDKSRMEFEKIAREEETHIQTVKDILKRLDEEAASPTPRLPKFF